jgi:hypothetical protein
MKFKNNLFVICIILKNRSPIWKLSQSSFPILVLIFFLSSYKKNSKKRLKFIRKASKALKRIMNP